jgi:aryl-alcohol dehydrogenase-like predicted oxidoreductase
MTFGQQNTEAEGHAQMDYALDQGVNFFDTAELYSIPPKAETHGSTERIIGSWLKARGKRDTGDPGDEGRRALGQWTGSGR